MSANEATPTTLSAVIVLAAGAGTRMKSVTPKVLHTVAGRSLLGHAISAARSLHPQRVCVVVRHQRDAVVDHALAVDPELVIADQDDIPGTGRAVQCALEALGELSGPVLVTAGDTPLLDGEELAGLAEAHATSGNDITVLSARVRNPRGYGRIVRTEAGAVRAIVEEKDASEAERAIDEVNTATYVFDSQLLADALSDVGQDNAQGEVYLTDVIAIAVARGKRVGAHVLSDPATAEGANDRSQLAQLGAELNRRTMTKWMRAGVTIIDPGSTWIDVDVSFGTDVTIHPGCQVLGATTIGDGVQIGPDTTIANCEVGAEAKIIRTHANLAMVGTGAHVGPFVHLGPDSRVLDGERIHPFSDITSIDAATREG